MTQPYYDLLALTGKDPEWWDEEGVPRFVSFEPGLCNSIYAEEAALVLIECQACGRRLRVAFTWSKVDEILRGYEPLSRLIADGSLYYGDAPCWRLGEPQCPGTTMTCYDLRVVEFWKRENDDWKRDPAYERPLADG